MEVALKKEKTGTELVNPKTMVMSPANKKHLNDSIKFGGGTVMSITGIGWAVIAAMVFAWQLAGWWSVLPSIALGISTLFGFGAFYEKTAEFKKFDNFWDERLVPAVKMAAFFAMFVVGGVIVYEIIFALLKDAIGMWTIIPMTGLTVSIIVVVVMFLCKYESSSAPAKETDTDDD